jgi:iron complex outermembrane receptor protein
MAMSAATASHAQTEVRGQQQASDEVVISDIVVTAQKRSERLQEVPVAITALTGEAIANKRITDVVDLSSQAPGLQVSTGDAAANPHIFLRGVGVNDFNLTTASAIGIYSDGAYLGSPLSQKSAFFDLQQVEVLRGPQGTLYGRNTTGGAINITSRRPTKDWEANASVEYGRFNALKMEGGISGPIVPDVLLFRIAGTRSTDDGYMFNRLTGEHVNKTNRWALRGSLRFTPTSNITNDLIFTIDHSQGDSIIGYNRTLLAPDGSLCSSNYTSGQCTNVAGYANASPNLYEGDYRFIGKDRVRYNGLTNNLTIDLGASSLVAVTAYQKSDRKAQEETDLNPIPIIDIDYISTQKTFSQELRFQSNGKTPLRYVFGIYYAHDVLTNDSVLRLPIFGIDLGWPLKQTSNSYAGFAQIDYDVSDKLTITGGLRYSSDHKHFVYDSIEEVSDTLLFHYDESKTFSSWSGKLGLQYKFSPAVNAYASYSRGTKSGGFFSGQTADPRDLGPYRDENVNAYEVGLKSELLDRKVTLNLSGFYYDYKDLQVYTLVPRAPLDVQVFTNASAARIYGAEFELSVRPARGLSIDLNGSLLHAKYKDFISSSASADYTGNTLPYAPKATLQGSISYDIPTSFGAITTNLSANYRSKIFFDTTNTARISDPGRTYADARAGVKFGADENFEIGVWAKNIFDETNIGLITPIPSLGYDFFTVGPPRTYGLYARANF